MIETDDADRITAARAARAFELAGDRLAERGIDELDVARALVAAGMARLSRQVGALAAADEVGALAEAIAEAARRAASPSARPH